MSHTVSGLIRRAPHIQQGQNNNGTYTMFCFELSEFIKGTQGAEDSYTNYGVALFAKTPGAIEFHQKAIAENAFVVVSCDKLSIDKQTGNDGREFIKLKMMNASLDNFNNPNQQSAPQKQQAPAQQQGFHTPAQSQQRQQSGGFTQQGQQQAQPKYANGPQSGGFAQQGQQQQSNEPPF